MTSMATLEDIVARIGVKMEEAAEARKEADRAFAESRKETDRALAESRKETDRALAESRKELDRSIKELADMQKEADRRMKELEKNMGGLNRGIGEIVEMMVIPGVMEQMNKFGHDFGMTSTNKRYKADGGVFAEVDLLLENTAEVMMVEVKTRVTIGWVNDHLRRLELLRKKESVAGLSGKAMYAAIAGIKFDKEARALAVSKGMYVIEIDEEMERFKVVPPATVGSW